MLLLLMQIIDIYYIMSVAGTTVFPSTNLLNDAEAFFTQIKEVNQRKIYPHLSRQSVKYDA